jgi:hypothetical protein
LDSTYSVQLRIREANVKKYQNITLNDLNVLIQNQLIYDWKILSCDDVQKPFNVLNTSLKDMIYLINGCGHIQLPKYTLIGHLGQIQRDILDYCNWFKID